MARVRAVHDLAAWKLARLHELRDNGHASWREVAEQEVTVSSAAANAKAAEQYLGTIVDWQTRLANVDLPESSADDESVLLYMPRTARLVAWMSTDVASVELSRRHLDNLQREYRSLSEIDVSSLETKIESNRQAVKVFGRSERDAHLLDRAAIQLRLAVAEHEWAMARKAAAKIIARRMVLVRDSLRAIEPRRRPKLEPKVPMN